MNEKCWAWERRETLTAHTTQLSHMFNMVILMVISIVPTCAHRKSNVLLPIPWHYLTNESEISGIKVCMEEKVKCVLRLGFHLQATWFDRQYSCSIVSLSPPAFVLNITSRRRLRGFVCDLWIVYCGFLHLFVTVFYKILLIPSALWLVQFYSQQRCSKEYMPHVNF